MAALQAHPALRLPVGRLAPLVVGASAVAGLLVTGAIALIRPSEVPTAVVGAGSVVLATGGMYAALALVRVRHLLSLTTIVMGAAMARLMASVVLGMGYMFTAVSADGAKPDKFVFAAAFLGVSLVVLAVETPVLRSTIRRLGGGATRQDASASARKPGDADGSAPPTASAPSPGGQC